jgi:hypothetical protein
MKIQKQGEKIVRKINAALIIFVTLLSACTSQASEDAVLTAIAETEISGVTPSPTKIPTSTNTPLPTNTPTTVPTFTPTPLPAAIPGADPELLVSVFAKLGIPCSGPTQTESSGFLWVCKDDTTQAERYDSFYAFYYGKTETNIDQILVRVVPLTVTASHSFIVKLLGYLSTVPYDNSTPEDTRLWVESTFLANATLEKESYDASGVLFTLDKNKTGYSMEIGERDPVPAATDTPEPVIGGISPIPSGDQPQLGNINIQDGPVSVNDIALLESNGDWLFVGFLKNSSNLPANFAKINVVVRDGTGKMVASESAQSALNDLYNHEKSPFQVTIPKADVPSLATFDLTVEYKLMRPASYKYLAFEDVNDAQITSHSLNGKVNNTGDETAAQVKVVGILFDENGKMLGWTSVDLDEIEAEASASFELQFTDVLDGTAKSFDLFVEAEVSEEEQTVSFP